MRLPGLPGMQTSARAWLAASGLVLMLSPGVARDTAALTTTHFVEVGDSIAAMLDASSLAFSSVVFGAADAAPAHLRAAFAPDPPRAAAQVFRGDCPGGGHAVVTVSAADPGGDLTPGDRYATEFESCAIDGSVMTGRSEFVVASHRYVGAVENTELLFHFDGLGTADLRWTGPARVMLSTDHQRGNEHRLVEYRDLAVQQGQRHGRWNFELDVVRPPVGYQVASVRGAMSVGDLHVRLQQDEPFLIAADGFPRAGRLTASDAGGARLQVEPGRWHYEYRLFLAANHGERADAASQSRSYRRP